MAGVDHLIEKGSPAEMYKDAGMGVQDIVDGCTAQKKQMVATPNFIPTVKNSSN